MGKARRDKRPELPGPGPCPQEGLGLTSNALFAFAVLALLTGLLYANALQNEFVFDDYELVVDNKQIRSLTKIPDILGIGEAKRRYRPVRFISYSLDYFLFGLNPSGYHATNVLYHVFNVFLVYLIIRRLLDQPRVALLAAILFAVHPIQTDAVTYISGRRDVLSTLFYLLGFYAFLRYRAENQAWYLVLVFVTFVLGLFTKEMVVTLPILMLGYDWYRNFPTNHAKIDLTFFRSIGATLLVVLRRYGALYGPILVLAGLFLIEKLFVHNPSRMEGLYGSTYFLHALSICRIFANYIFLLCFPLTLNADYSYNAFPVTSSPFEPSALGALLLLGAIAVGLLKALQHEKHMAFGMLWFFLTLLPVSQLVPHHEPMAEHYLYLPSVGFCLVVAIGFQKLLDVPRARSVAYVALGVLVVLLALRTTVRNLDWKDDQTLWEKTVQTAPNSSRAHDNLGTVYAKQGKFILAIEHFQEALRIWPKNPAAYDHLGRAYYANEQWEEARAAFQKAVNLQPDFVPAQMSLGQVLGQQGLVDGAIAAFRSVIRNQPRNTKAHFRLGTAYYKKGLVEKAIAQYGTTLSLDPSYWKAYRNLGIIYQEQRKPNEAIQAYQSLLVINPNHVETHLNLAGLYLGYSPNAWNKADSDQALAHLQTVLTLEPNHAERRTIKQMIATLTE